MHTHQNSSPSDRPPVGASVGSDGDADAESVASVWNRIDDEGEHVDTALEGFGILLALVATVSASGVAAMVSPAVQESLENGWVAVFLATLTWSLGCAGCTVLIKRSGLGGWPLASACVGMFLAAMAVAAWLGTGYLDLTPTTEGQNPLATLAGFARVAFEVYGPIGALLGGGVGYWLGSRFSVLFEEGFLR